MLAHFLLVRPIKKKSLPDPTLVGRSPTSPTGEEGRVTSVFTGLFPAASAVEACAG